MRLTAEHGDGWITLGRADDDRESCLNVVTTQCATLDAALASVGRSSDKFEKVLLSGFGEERPLESLDAFVDWVGRYQEIGLNEVVIHWPEADSIFAADMKVFEDIATHGLSQL